MSRNVIENRRRARRLRVQRAERAAERYARHRGKRLRVVDDDFDASRCQARAVNVEKHLDVGFAQSVIEGALSSAS